jgi:hypothetical protein
MIQQELVQNPVLEEGDRDHRRHRSGCRRTRRVVCIPKWH